MKKHQKNFKREFATGFIISDMVSKHEMLLDNGQNGKKAI